MKKAQWRCDIIIYCEILTLLPVYLVSLILHSYEVLPSVIFSRKDLEKNIFLRPCLFSGVFDRQPLALVLL